MRRRRPILSKKTPIATYSTEKALPTLRRFYFLVGFVLFALTNILFFYSHWKKDYEFTPYEEPSPQDHFDVQFLANSSYFMTRRLVDNIINGNDTSIVENSLLVHGKEERAECMDVKRVVCDIGPDQFFEEAIQIHLAHFAQLVFPCFSVLRRFPHDVEKYIQMPIGQHVPQRIGEWKGDLVHVIENSGIKFIEQHENESTDNYKKCQWKVVIPKLPSSYLVFLNFEIEKNNTEMLHPKHNDLKWKRRSSIDYFVSFVSHSDMVSLQQSVLGSKFQSGVSRDEKIHVLVLNRIGNRRLTYGEKIAKEIKRSILGQKDDIEVTYLKDMSEVFNGLYGQALSIHSADIIISPHGAQLTNLAFMKPCTVVAEIFPLGYFVDFFQPYVTTAHGISYRGYESGRNPFIDSRIGLSTYWHRRWRRMGVINVSTESIIQALPKFIHDFQTCRTNNARKDFY